MSKINDEGMAEPVATQEPVGHFLEDFGGRGHWHQCNGPMAGTQPLYRAATQAQPVAAPAGWRELAERCAVAMAHAIRFDKTGEGRPPEQTCAQALEDLRAMLAAAPAAPAPAQAQPLTDADRKDAARYRWLRSRPLAAEEEIYIGVESDRVPDLWALKGDECDAIVDEFMADNPIGQPAGKGGA